MLTAISRYGVRLAPETEDLFKQCEARGELIEGPHIAAFERAALRAQLAHPCHQLAHDTPRRVSSSSAPP